MRVFMLALILVLAPDPTATVMPDICGLDVHSALEVLAPLPGICNIDVEWLCCCIDHDLERGIVDHTLPPAGQPVDVSVTVVAFIPGCPR